MACEFMCGDNHRVRIWHLWVILLAFGYFLCCESYVVDSNPYRHVETLDGEGRYILEWMVDWENKRVIFNVTAETHGYIGFGLSRRGKMTGADIVIGGVSPDGKAYFTDRHAVGNQLPVLDEHQDWTLHGAWESATHTFLSFSRAFDTCDKDDYPITEDLISLIWAIGENDDSIEYHFYNRGSYEVYLLDPDLAPQVAQPLYRTKNPTEMGDLKVWSINKLEVLPPKETFYTCSFHKAPRFPKKHHIVGFNTVLHSDLEKHLIHHFFLYRCHPPVGRDAAAFFERYVRNRGEECYTMSSRADKIPTLNCQEPVHIWAVGGKPVFLPDHVGIPMSEATNEYFMIQTHYENPQRVPSIRLRFSLEVFYTANLRKHDAGAMIVGQKQPASPSIILPPSSLGHTIYGHCGEDCTKQMLPPVGIQIFATSLHTHFTGKGTRLLHIRDHEEEPWISYDDNYSPRIQRTRFLRKERTILPGDQLISRCTYQTTGRGHSIIGGVQLRNEICMGVVWYYNRIPGYGICNSEIGSELYYARLGFTNVTWSDEKLEMVATAPKNVAGVPVSEIVHRLKWTIHRRTQLQEDHRYLPQLNQCPQVIPGFEPHKAFTEAPISPPLQRYKPKAGKLEVLPTSEYISIYSKDVIPFERAQNCVKQPKEVVHHQEFQSNQMIAGAYPTGEWWTINSKAQGY